MGWSDSSYTSWLRLHTSKAPAVTPQCRFICSSSFCGNVSCVVGTAWLRNKEYLNNLMLTFYSEGLLKFEWNYLYVTDIRLAKPQIIQWTVNWYFFRSLWVSMQSSLKKPTLIDININLIKYFSFEIWESIWRRVDLRRQSSPLSILEVSRAQLNETLLMTDVPSWKPQ